MPTSAIPPSTEVPGDWNISTLLLRRAARDPNGTIIETHNADGTWSLLSAAEFLQRVEALAKGLIARGIKPGSRVAIMSHTSFEWTLFDFALWAAGAMSVPIYETSSRDQAQWICEDAGIDTAIVENGEYGAMLESLRPDVPGLAEVWTMDGATIAQLVAEGASVTDAQLAEHRDAAGADAIATIIYTSGTTGRSKGVELTHGNFVRLVENCNADKGDLTLTHVVTDLGCRTLLFLPLAHVFARFIEIICIGSNTVLGHCPDTHDLVEDLQSFSPTFVLAVPRVFEKVYNAAEQKAGHGPKLKIFRWSAKVAIVYSRALDGGKRFHPWLATQHALAEKIVYGKLRAVMGGKAQYAVSGGGALGERLGHFYRGIGMVVLEGYGLTETTGPFTVNRPQPMKQRIGSVGLPWPGCEVRVDNEGEIFLRGIGVSRHYHGNPTADAESFDDEGWFRTGDIGRLDKDGYLFITGRKKEIIVTAGGKNVAPAVLEDRLRGHPLVSQCVVVGEGKPFIGVLITLDEEMLPGWLAGHGIPPVTLAQARTHPAVLESMRNAVARANEVVSRAESIRKFRILEGDFTIANGFLTPSLKVKRAEVLRAFSNDIDELYSGVK